MQGKLISAAVGAAIMYFLDPDRGRRRRHVARDRGTAVVRGSFRKLGRAGRFVVAQIYGLKQKAAHRTPAHPLPPNDATLAHKVESEVFRDPNIPKGRININAEGGVVVLRGQLERSEQINSVESAVRRVPGVRGVENLLHLPGTPAPRH